MMRGSEGSPMTNGVPYATDTNHRDTKLTLCCVRGLLGTLCNRYES
jgi:hypothetical protein